MRIDEFLKIPEVEAQPLVGASAPTSGEWAWPSRVKHLSASSIGMFRRCPEQWRRRYILGEKERPGEALVIGSMVHEALEFNYLQKVETKEDLPVTTIVEYLQDEAVPKVLEEDGGMENISWDAATPEKGVAVARKDSERMTVRYTTDVVPRIQPVGVEEKFSLDVPGLPVPVIGYVDTRTDDARIIDVKTGKQSVSKMKPSWMLQAVLYAAATDLTVEYHSVSRAATPKITTGLESDAMITKPNLVAAANVFSTAAQIGWMISQMYATFGPDDTWPTMGRFADWSMSFSPCTNCGWRKTCPAMAGEA